MKIFAIIVGLRYILKLPSTLIFRYLALRFFIATFIWAFVQVKTEGEGVHCCIIAGAADYGHDGVEEQKGGKRSRFRCASGCWACFASEFWISSVFPPSALVHHRHHRGPLPCTFGSLAFLPLFALVLHRHRRSPLSFFFSFLSFPLSSFLFFVSFLCFLRPRLR